MESFFLYLFVSSSFYFRQYKINIFFSLFNVIYLLFSSSLAILGRPDEVCTFLSFFLFIAFHFIKYSFRKLKFPITPSLIVIWSWRLLGRVGPVVRAAGQPLRAAETCARGSGGGVLLHPRRQVPRHPRRNQQGLLLTHRPQGQRRTVGYQGGKVRKVGIG